MKKIRLKSKKKNRMIIRVGIILFLFSFSFCFFIQYFANSMDSSNFVKMLLKQNSSHISIKTDIPFFTKFISFVANVNLSEPSSIIRTGYGNSTSSDDEQNLDSIPSSNYIKDPFETEEAEKPLVYIYNSHQSEEYASNNIESYNVTPTVMMASYILREKLNNNDIPAIVEENDVTEFLKTNNWNYAASYKVTKLLMEDAYSKNPSLEYFIDLHRDSVNKKISTATIREKQYAKILFIVGLENKNYDKNLALTEKLNDMFDKKYPGLSRGIYKKQGAGVNGVYNQDFHPNTILIEVGGEENTIDEVFNTCTAISEILVEYINGEKK